MSKISEEIIKQIKAEMEARGLNPSSLDELNKIAGAVMNRQNNKALSDFQGLSAHQMAILNNQTFSDQCIVRFNDNMGNDTVHDSVIMRASVIILENIDSVKGLKLTEQGNLPRKVVSLIFGIPLPGKDENRYKPENVPNEKDYLPSAMAHALLIISKTAIVRNNKLFMTAQGKKIIKNRHLLFRTLFEAFVTRYNKGYFDLYGENGVGNVGIGYVIYILNLYGKVNRPAEFYSDLYFRAFPMLIEQVRPFSFSDSKTAASDCFILRVFISGLNYLGLIEMQSEQGKNFFRKYQVRVSPIFQKVFDIKSDPFPPQN